MLGLTIKGELQPVIRHLALKVPRSLYGDGHLHAHGSNVRTVGLLTPALLFTCRGGGGLWGGQHLTTRVCPNLGQWCSIKSCHCVRCCSTAETRRRSGGPRCCWSQANILPCLAGTYFEKLPSSGGVYEVSSMVHGRSLLQ